MDASSMACLGVSGYLIGLALPLFPALDVPLVFLVLLASGAVVMSQHVPGLGHRLATVPLVAFVIARVLSAVAAPDALRSLQIVAPLLPALLLFFAPNRFTTVDGRAASWLLWWCSVCGLVLGADAMARSVDQGLVLLEALRRLKTHPVSPAFTRVAAKPLDWKLRLSPLRRLTLAPLIADMRMLESRFATLMPFEKIAFPRMARLPLSTRIPLCPLNAMMLPANAASPPSVFTPEPVFTKTPCTRLPSGWFRVQSVPIRLPRMVLPLTSAPRTTPSRLAEMTFPAPAAALPTMLSCVPLNNPMPANAFPMAAEPAALVPM